MCQRGKEGEESVAKGIGEEIVLRLYWWGRECALRGRNEEASEGMSSEKDE